MKKLLTLLLLTVSSIYAQNKEFTFSAIIKNPNSDSLVIRSKSMQKVIKADKKGNFKDSFSLTTGLYQLYDGKEYSVLYLDNSYDLDMTVAADSFDKTIHFTGKGAAENNFLAKKMLADQVFISGLDDLPNEPNAAQKIVDDRARELRSALENPEIGETFKNLMITVLTQEKKQLEAMAKRAQEAQKMKGKPSPLFTYENHKGGTTSLKDFRGKYVYIDVWATWCGPCRKEIPYLQKIEKKYHDKDIVFVSISVDKEKDHTKWKKFVDKEALGGVQLIADKDWKSDFIAAYDIHSIPRFLLIDPKGNVVRSDAARPSDPALQELLDKLLK
ncbi:TlpA family protein disulfide reductase [Flavobacterium arcticum]|uniref:TlpA family protein disulfide reductase n=1 Tax=Flavobacterium arcticum TaxID=1784713 RepID=A0A345HAC9_9FLAO|nr:TlpA disulfide reductase family protein [Flavobacterium arcticum]AXG73539.1 TlpA family protein disulfide reductase [Flavobacterium arcticum]KAF2513330.1 TlpA family protein disulfide reductase [Flavobacterium arcticum]